MRVVASVVKKFSRMMKMMSRSRHELLRRAANHNVHVLTPHGRVQAGRKGRKG
jgi:hypothetical protein